MNHDLTIRLSRDEDALALGRLAQLDDTLWDGRPALVAETAGELFAAVPVDGGAAYADPFRRTKQVVSLLELRRGQLAAPVAPAGGGVSRALRAARRRRRYRAPVSA